MPETQFDEWMAAHYEVLWPELFDPAVVDPAVSLLAELAAAAPGPGLVRKSSRHRHRTRRSTPPAPLKIHT